MCLIHTFFRNSPPSGKTATAAPSKKRKPRQLAMADSDSDSEEEEEEEEHMLPLEVDSTAHVHSNNVDDDDDSDGDSRLVICEPSSSSQEAGIGTRDSELEKDSLHYSPVTGSPINTVDLSFEQTEVHVHAPGSQSSCEDSDLEEADVIPPVVRVGNSGVGHGAAGNGSVGADTNTAGSMGELAIPGTVPEKSEAQDGGSGPGQRLSGKAVSTLLREGRRESVVTRKRRFRPLLELESSDEEDY